MEWTKTMALLVFGSYVARYCDTHGGDKWKMGGRDRMLLTGKG